MQKIHKEQDTKGMSSVMVTGYMKILVTHQENRKTVQTGGHEAPEQMSPGR